MPGVIQTVRAELDRASIREIHGEIVAVGDAIAGEIQARLDGLEGNEAGRKAAENALRGMKEAFDADLQALRLKAERGMIRPEEFERQAQEAARRFNAAIVAEITRLANDPSFSVNPFKGIKSDPKDVERVNAEGKKLGDAWVEGVIEGTSGATLPTPDTTEGVEGARQAGEDAFSEFKEAVEGGPPPVVPPPDPSDATGAARGAGEAVGDAIGEGMERSDVPGSAEEIAREAATGFVEGIVAETRRRRAEVKLAQMEGLLSEREAADQGDKITRAHNRAVLEGVRRFRTGGQFTPEVLGIFTGAFEVVERDVPPESFWTRIQGKIRTRLAMIGTSIVGFFTLRALARFGGSALGEAVEDESAFAALASQIDATGASFDRLSPRIERMADAMADRGIASTGRFARGLSELIAVSGDAEKSLNNMGLVADFARKHHISFEQAVDIVGRAMVGQVTNLKRYGIAVKEGDDAVIAIANSLEGFNRNQAPTTRDRLNAMAIAWADLKGAIGETAIEAGGGTSALDMITTALRDGTRFVREHKEEFAALARTIGEFIAFLIRDGLKGILDFADRTRIEIANVSRFFRLFGAGIGDLVATLKDLAGAYYEVAEAVRNFLGDEQGAAIARRRAEEYREQSRELRRIAEANREVAKSERERAEAARRALRERATGTGHTGAGDTVMSRLIRGEKPGDTSTGEVGGAVTRVGEGRDNANDLLDKRIALLTKALGFERTRREALAELTRIEIGVNRALQNTELSLEKRIDLEEKLFAIERAREGLLAPLGTPVPPVTLAPPKMQTRKGEPGEDLTLPTPIMPRQPTAEEAREFAENMKQILHDEVTAMVAEIGAESPPIQLGFADDLIYTFFSNLETFATNSATGIVETFEDVFSRIGSEAMSVNEILGQLGKGMAQSILREIAAMAKGKAIENVAIAIEETAKGFAALASFNPASASLHFKAAGTAALAAVKWGLVAGGVGALAGGGGGGGPGGGTNREGEDRDPLRGGRDRVTFFIKGGLLNTDDPAQMDALAAGIAAVSDKDIVVRRG